MSSLLILAKVLDLALLAAQQAPVLYAQFAAIKGEIDQMVAEGRDPTPEEWASLGTRVDAKLAALRAQVVAEGGQVA